jgi:hypothetical protein
MLEFSLNSNVARERRSIFTLLNALLGAFVTWWQTKPFLGYRTN